jgi:predicted Zn-dependent protease with MMP-like domain
MYSVNYEEFEKLVHQSVDNLPKVHKDKIKNVGFFVLDFPTQEQVYRSKLKPGQMLLGLYEGVPLSKRGGTLKLLPDTITLFKRPIEMSVNSYPELLEQIHKTVWHEVAHYFGLDHDKIYEIQDKNKH